MQKNAFWSTWGGEPATGGTGVNQQRTVLTDKKTQREVQEQGYKAEETKAKTELATTIAKLKEDFPPVGFTKEEKASALSSSVINEGGSPSQYLDAAHVDERDTIAKFPLEPAEAVETWTHAPEKHIIESDIE